MTKNIMLDLETMGKGSNAPIIAIGAVAFDSTKVTDKFYAEVSLQSAIDGGGVVDGSTIMWWLQQSEAAREAFKNNDDAMHLMAALNNFRMWYKDVGGDDVYGNGATFDNVILANAYKNSSVPVPWEHGNDMCYRTIKNMHKDIELERIGTHHNAVDDAESQALHLIKIWSKHDHENSQ